MKKSILYSALVALTAALSAPLAAFAEAETVYGPHEAHIVNIACHAVALRDTATVGGVEVLVKKGEDLWPEVTNETGALAYVPRYGYFPMSDITLLNCTVEKAKFYNDSFGEWKHKLLPIPSKFTLEQNRVRAMKDIFKTAGFGGSYYYLATAYVTGTSLCQNMLDKAVQAHPNGQNVTPLGHTALVNAAHVCLGELKEVATAHNGLEYNFDYDFDYPQYPKH